MIGDPDWAIRAAAFTTLDRAVAKHGPVLPWSVIEKGFSWQRQDVRFASMPRGIFRPRQMRGGALSIKTTIPKRGKQAKYEDLATDGAFIYRLQGTDPNAYDNQRLLLSARERWPMIYLYGIAPGWYRPLWPAYAHFLEDELACRVLVADSGQIREPGTFAADPMLLDLERRYTTVLAKKRLHQDAFRHHVIGAYEKRCCICRLPRTELLDAAHIIPDRDVRGLPRIPNGLALCRLHHGAFDADLLGIRPDRVIEISPRLLDEQDGPTLEHAIKAFHHQSLHAPTKPAHEPDPNLLEERYTRFRHAS